MGTTMGSRYLLLLLTLAAPGQSQSQLIRPRPVEPLLLLNKSRSSGDTGTFTTSPGVVVFHLGGASVSISLTSATEMTGQYSSAAGGFFVLDSTALFYLGLKLDHDNRGSVHSCAARRNLRCVEMSGGSGDYHDSERRVLHREAAESRSDCR
jgi:hypothetical protein